MQYTFTTSMNAYAGTLLFILLLLSSEIVWSSELTEQLVECSKEVDRKKRLSCYDALADNYRPADKTNYILPDQEFLHSKLVITPEASDYNLTVNDFVELILNAVMDDGKKVEVLGWTKEKESFVLHIIMRGPVQLQFLPMATENIPMSILLSPTIDGQPTDPELFIMTIASMIPDDRNAKDQ